MLEVKPMSKSVYLTHVRCLVAVGVAAAALSACKTPMPQPAPAPAPAPVATRPAPAPAPVPAPAPAGVSSSQATSEKAYRADGARHIYAKHGSQVFRGMLPPNIPGVGIVDTTIDARGNVTNISWRRRPSDESFMPITERLIRAAAPFPVPARMGKVVYTDIWLWDKSGQFQLDTLTEGQRNN
jgi:periplasmic protein TonB